MNRKLYEYVVNHEHRKSRHGETPSLCEGFAAENLSHTERMVRRFEILTSLETPIILDGERIVFQRTVTNIPDILTKEEWDEIKKIYPIHEYGYSNNVNPNYYKMIAKGLIAAKEEADEYGKRSIDAIIALSDRYKEEAKRLGRDDIVATLEQVPRYPARTFREALQFFRILHFSLWLEGNYHLTIGRFDVNMYPYLKADLDSGILDEESALDLLEEFFLTFNKDSDLYIGVQMGDNGQSMMLGGVDAEGNDVYNLLSALCLKASYNNKLIDPKINLRVNKNTPTERFIEATELTKAGLGFPQYSNDDVVIPGLIKLGYAPEDAANYTVAACWEFIIPGLGMEIPNIDALSFPKVIDVAVRNHLTTSSSFDEFYKKVGEAIISEVNALTSRHSNLFTIKSPLLMLTMDFDPNVGAKYNNFGIHGVGIATAADSLAAIKKYVYEECSLSKEDLISALDKNFEGYPELLHKLRFEAPKVGYNDDYADSFVCDLLEKFADALKGKKNSLGGIYRAGTGSAMNYLWKANEIGASPDGRLEKEPFGTNFSVSLFAKTGGPVSVIGSMTKPNFINAINGGPLTMEFHGSVFQDNEGVEKVATLVKRFVELGGHQLQLNAVNPEILLDAKAHPENHKRLIVRIWGWSAYFTELAPEYQDHVIARQVYKV